MGAVYSPRRATALRALFRAVILFSWSGQIAVAASSPYAKNEIVFPNDPFEQRSQTGLDSIGWIKFTIPKEPTGLGPITYQDSHTYLLHYDFVSRYLDPYVGISPEEFDRISLYQEGQKLILGAVITPPTAYPVTNTIQELGIQFVRHDAYTKEEIAHLFNVVKATILADPNVTMYYFPTYEQAEVARNNLAWFAAQGIPVSSSDRWSRGNVIYSAGWAFGRLRHIPSGQIQSAYMQGELLTSDILLTDAVPAEIPVVAGIISLSPSTPNSHVAILATARGIPFVYLPAPGLEGRYASGLPVGADASTAAQALALRDHEIVLRTASGYRWDSQVDLLDMEGALSEEQADQLRALKRPPDLSIRPLELRGVFRLPMEQITLDDIRYVGGKAAHYSLLREAVPHNSETAVAFTFDLWHEFLDQRLAAGVSLREEIDRRLADYTFPPANMAALEQDLSVIRSLFTDEQVTQFSERLRDAVIATLTDKQYGFDAGCNLRFRSSTNVEDIEHFTGAGLYDSYSGCLADDLDEDENGPSHCDPNEQNERGVFRAIRKVFASFYNTNAFVERLRYRIDENQVGMALLVHCSFPDDIELANGVATVDVSPSSSCSITLVTQTGAVSVTNPDPGVVPEQVTATVSSTGGTYLSLQQQSNLLPLGQMVMIWEQDYRTLSQLLVAVAREYGRATGRTQYLLDLEYKKVAPDGRLILKQIRPIPQSDPAAPTPALLVSQPVRLEVLQGEHGEIFANHRLKSVWHLDCQSQWLTPESLQETFFTDIELEYVDGDQVRKLAAPVALLPSFRHEGPLPNLTVIPAQAGIGSYEVRDSWSLPDLHNSRSYTLHTTQIPAAIPGGECPVLTPADLHFECDVRYDRAVPVPAYGTTPCATTTTMEDHVVLSVPPGPSPDDLLQTRTVGATHASPVPGVTIRTQFYWPPPPSGPTAGYTAPLVRWVETTITGLTSTPILLQNSYAQTYLPGHHNFWETFLFEPRLDPGVPSEALAELQNRGVGRILVSTPEPGSVCLYDADDSP
jgi:hypothetical protein